MKSLYNVAFVCFGCLTLVVLTRQSGVCPDGYPMVQCYSNPCDHNLCERHPGAKCVANYCGGCTAEYFLGDIKLSPADCSKSTCPGNDYVNCGFAPQCTAETCEAHPDATCRSSNCGVCKVWFEDEYGNEVDCKKDDGGCPPGLPQVRCKANPCDVTSCPAQPKAECKANYCGGCNADFYLRGRKLTDIECVKKVDECAAFTSCFVNVCNCPVHPDAQCIVQYCEPNQCKPLYFDKKGSSLSYEDCGLCSDGSQHINCGIVPQCMVQTCDAHPGAKCRTSNCGVCKVWFEDENGKEVNCKRQITCKVPSSFANGVISPNDRETVNEGENVLYKCLKGFKLRRKGIKRCVNRRGKGKLIGSNPKCIDINECKQKRRCGYNARCQNFPGSYRCECKPGYYGEATTMCKSVCPGGKPQVQCFANPCDVNTCERHPEAKCVPNYCGGCIAEFFLGDIKLSPKDCAKSACPDGDYVNCGVVPQCMYQTCHAHPEAKCRSSNCGICKVWFEDEYGNEVYCKM